MSLYFLLSSPLFIVQNGGQNDKFYLNLEPNYRGVKMILKRWQHHDFIFT